MSVEAKRLISLERVHKNVLLFTTPLLIETQTAIPHRLHVVSSGKFNFQHHQRELKKIYQHIDGNLNLT